MASFNNSSDKFVIGILRDLILTLVASAASLFNELCHCYAVEILIQNLYTGFKYNH
ncbi:MAG TPA: hypothetical protein [Caudoviricetes sp.]|nr:MAG TPA: hypothetical protein [Caudoviricetes sp.]